MASQYESAASIMQRVLQREATTRAVFEARADNASTPVVHALVCETLKHRDLITTLIDGAPTLRSHLDASSEEPISAALASVLVFELLFGKKKIAGGGRFKRIVQESACELAAALTALLAERGVASVADLLPKSNATPTVARFARVNTLKASFEDASRELSATFELVSTDGIVAERCMRVDDTLPYVFEFAPGTDLHAHALVKRGALVLQDKSSCLPAHCLMPPSDAIVIDACAAPGNKTTQLAALMGAGCRGTILAFDRDKKRFGTLNETIGRLGARVDTVCADFVRCAKAVLKPEPSGNQFAGPSTHRRDVFEYLATATHALVDPSCSGSGLVGRDAGLNLEHDIGQVDHDRIEKLARFQHEVLVSAMCLPAMQRVVYSTCSVHERENEDVVRAVLADNRLRRRWRQIDALPGWPRRGTEASGAIGQLCLRTDPAADRTSGFFVALFEKIDGAVADDVDEAHPKKRKEPQQQQQQQQQQHKKAKTKQAPPPVVTSTKKGKKRKTVKRPLTH